MRLSGLLFACAVCIPSSAEIVRYHGIQINEQYEVLLEQRGGDVAIILSGRQSPAGGPLKQFSEEGETTTAYRLDNAEILVHVRSEILKPAPPNYLSNPGSRYRVTVRGETLEPDLVVMHEVAASEMREVLVGELNAIASRSSGLYREAMYYGTQLTLGVLKASGYLPAEVPETIQRSQVGQIRGLGEGLERRSLPAGRNLNPIQAGTPAGPPSRVDLRSPTSSSQPAGYLGPLSNPPAPGSASPLAFATPTEEVEQP